jgi:hypothetical protein
VEIRFLRLAIQSKSPSWLGYHTAKSADLQFIYTQMELDTCSEKDVLPAIARNLAMLGIDSVPGNKKMTVLQNKTR